MSNGSTIFSFPGENRREWRQYKAGKQKWVQSSAPSKFQSQGYVFDAKECLSVPLWINSCDPEEIQNIIAFEIESLLGRPIEPEQMEVSTIEKDISNGQSLVHITIIPDEIDE